MSAKQNDKNLLSSWKEIAAYLDCNARTCTRWEKHFGLPIHRIGGATKSRVYAYKEEVDEWLKKWKQKEQAKTAFFPHNKGLKALGIFLICVFFSVTFLAFKSLVLNRGGHAADFHMSGSKLILVDQNDKKIGEYDTGIDSLLGESSYRARFQSVSNARDKTGRVMRELPRLAIQDINGDKSPEILFSIQTKTEAMEGILICLNENGKKLWEYKAGREIKFGTTSYSSDYRIIGFMLCDFNADGLKEIVLTSAHRVDFPNQIVILNHRGKVKGEYWNSGYLNRCAVADLDKDGHQELLLAGCNNEYKKGCLVVFDPDNMNGGSPQNDDFYSSKGLTPGTEKYYILYPRTDLDETTSTIEAISSIDILNNYTVSVVAYTSQIIFDLDFDMNLSRIRTGHLFQELYIQAKREGKVRGEINDLYRQNLASGLLYFDGQNWTSIPTMASN